MSDDRKMTFFAPTQNQMDPLARIVFHEAHGSREKACELACDIAGDTCRFIVEKELSMSCEPCGTRNITNKK